MSLRTELKDLYDKLLQLEDGYRESEPHSEIMAQILAKYFPEASVRTPIADQSVWANVGAGSDTLSLSDLNTKLKAVRDKVEEIVTILQAMGFTS
jgi:hypothetical protein